MKTNYQKAKGDGVRVGNEDCEKGGLMQKEGIIFIYFIFYIIINYNEESISIRIFLQKNENPHLHFPSMESYIIIFLKHEKKI